MIALATLVLMFQDADALAARSARQYAEVDFAGALESARQAVALDADHARAQWWLALASIRAGGMEEARAALEAAARLGADVDEIALARAFAAARDFDEARRRLSLAEKARGTTPDVLEIRGIVTFELGTNDAEALHGLERAIAADPDRAVRLRLVIAQLLARLGRHSEALRCIESWRALKPPRSMLHQAAELEAAIVATMQSLADEAAVPLRTAAADLIAKIGHPAIREVLGDAAESAAALMVDARARAVAGTEIYAAMRESVAALPEEARRVRDSRSAFAFALTELSLTQRWGTQVPTAAHRRQRGRIVGAMIAAVWSGERRR